MSGRGSGRLISIFQPHRYSRTATFAEAFGGSFTDSDVVVLLDVYAAGEEPIKGVSGALIFDRALQAGHPCAHYVPSMDDVTDFIKPNLRPGDMVMTMGAGNVGTLGERILDELRSLPDLPGESSVADAA